MSNDTSFYAPPDGMVSCESCGNPYDPEDIIGGRCPECAKHFMDASDAFEYGISNIPYFVDWTHDNGKDVKELDLHKGSQVYRDFALDNFDDFRRFVVERKA